jgi:hypothetical protein
LDSAANLRIRERGCSDKKALVRPTQPMIEIFQKVRTRMFNPYEVIVGCQAALVNQCLKALLATMHYYAGLLDPRPDLAVPARSVKLPYAWWW